SGYFRPSLDPALEAFQTWRLGIDFLAQQCLHWSWSIRHKPILEWRDTDAREFMRFVMRRPHIMYFDDWRATAGVSVTA
ncbi:hypothetical protein, partial [Pseudomonas amygdali]|uniref:hypothetical protein n=1 Tax=Pseudomonas amygdali TaxID=47877 RepID=UPI0001CC1952